MRGDRVSREKLKTDNIAVKERDKGVYKTRQ